MNSVPYYNDMPIMLFFCCSNSNKMNPPVCSRAMSWPWCCYQLNVGRIKCQPVIFPSSNRSHRVFSASVPLLLHQENCNLFYTHLYFVHSWTRKHLDVKGAQMHEKIQVRSYKLILTRLFQGNKGDKTTRKQGQLRKPENGWRECE